MWPELHGPADQAARRLLGCHLVRQLDGQTITVKIVETEAYDQTDAASHSYKGQTARSAIMFGPPGRLYVYFTYGLHYCCNVVVGPTGEGAAVLIRAVEPLDYITLLEQRRGRSGAQITNGPAKLCQALGINKALNGHNLSQSPLRLVMQPPSSDSQVVQSVRIGISLAKDVPWRFYLRANPYVSKNT